MKYCQNCGTQLEDHIVVCPACGASVNYRANGQPMNPSEDRTVNEQQTPQNNQPPQNGTQVYNYPYAQNNGNNNGYNNGYGNGGYNQPVSDDAPSTGYALLGFFIPIVGLLLWVMEKDTKPKRANSAIKGALIGIILSVVFGVLAGIISAVAGFSMFYML